MNNIWDSEMEKKFINQTKPKNSNNIINTSNNNGNKKESNKISNQIKQTNLDRGLYGGYDKKIISRVNKADNNIKDNNEERDKVEIKSGYKQIRNQLMINKERENNINNLNNLNNYNSEQRHTFGNPNLNLNPNKFSTSKATNNYNYEKQLILKPEIKYKKNISNQIDNLKIQPEIPILPIKSAKSSKLNKVDIYHQELNEMIQDKIHKIMNEKLRKEQEKINTEFSNNSDNDNENNNTESDIPNIGTEESNINKII